MIIYVHFNVKNTGLNPYISIKNLSNILVIPLLPLMAVFGTYLVNFYDNNLLLIILLGLIAFLTVLEGYFRIFPKRMYSYVLFFIALSLILHTALTTDFLVGKTMDIPLEYQVSQLPHNAEYWDSSVKINNYNSVLSCTVLSTTIAKILDIQLIYVFKIIYPVFGAFIPIGMYSFFKSLYSPKKSYLSSLVLVYSITYFNNMLFSTKQLLGMLYLVLFLVVFFDTSLKNTLKSTLQLIFLVSITLSHYGITYLVLGMLITSYILEKIFDGKKINQIISKNVLGTYLLFTLIWYICTSQSSSFNGIFCILKNVLINFSNAFGNANATRGTYILTKKLVSLNSVVLKYLFISVIGLSVLGFTKKIFSKLTWNNDVKRTYLFFSGFWISILAATVLVPYFSVMSPYRLYGVAMLLIAPFVVEGFELILNKLSHVIKYFKNRENQLKMFSIFLFIFFIYNSQLMFEIFNDPSSISAAISQKTAFNGPPENIIYMYSKIENHYDNTEKNWFKAFGSFENYKIISYLNLKYNLDYKVNLMTLERKLVQFDNKINNSKIYDNSGSQIYLT